MYRYAVAIYYVSFALNQRVCIVNKSLGYICSARRDEFCGNFLFFVGNFGNILRDKFDLIILGILSVVAHHLAAFAGYDSPSPCRADSKGFADICLGGNMSRASLGSVQFYAASLLAKTLFDKRLEHFACTTEL